MRARLPARRFRCGAYADAMTATLMPDGSTSALSVYNDAEVYRHDF